MLQTLLCKGITKGHIENPLPFSSHLINMHISPITCCAFNIKPPAFKNSGLAAEESK